MQPVGGPAYVRGITRALRDLPLVATGNIELTEIPAYFEAGCVGFGVGLPMTRPDLIERGDDTRVTALAREYLAATRRGATPR